MNKLIKDVDQETWNKLKSIAILNNMKLSDAIRLLVFFYLKNNKK